MLTHTSLRLWNVPRAQPFDFWGGRGRGWYGWFDLGKISFFPTLWWHVFFWPWHTTSLYVRYFLARYFSFEISLQDIFFLLNHPPHLPSQKSNGWPQFQRFFFFHFFARLSGHSLNQVRQFLSLHCYFVSFSLSCFWGNRQKVKQINFQAWPWPGDDVYRHLKCSSFNLKEEANT